jgi:oxygen-independent coproporphyrinogen-3 oxidase
MAGIYIHIPFCRKACHYCNFHFSTSLHQKAGLVNAIEKEIIQFPVPPGAAVEREIETIYFGGGTPSLLDTGELEQLLSSIRRNFKITGDAEITLEANPDDINETILTAWKQLGINRLSIGIQSFVQSDLEWMNRAHTATQAIGSIELAREFGFRDFTIDLIYGTPTLTDEQWLSNLEMAASLGVNHLSCYALTVEEKTALNHFIQKGKLAPIDEAKQTRQFGMLMNWAESKGFEHYEISNFAKPNHRSKHNSNYWSGKAYYGFGPAAHSFDGNLTRWWNIANNPLYTEAINNNQPAFSFETLSPLERLNEKIMTGLRTIEGFDTVLINQATEEKLINEKEQEHFHSQVMRFCVEGMLVEHQEKISLTPAGIHFADGIASALFFG